MHPLFLLPSMILAAASTSGSQPSLIQLDLPQGQVSIEINGVEGNENGHGLVVHAGGDKEVLIDSDALPDVVAKHGNSALLRVFSGGNACPALYTWLTFDRDGLRATPAFGTCAEDGALVETKAYPAFILDEIGRKSGKVKYDFDGKTVKPTKLKN